MSRLSFYILLFAGRFSYIKKNRLGSVCMNHIWGGMLLLGILYGVVSGNLPAVTDGVIDSAGEAVSLCISMAGITAFWTGILKIAENAGILEQIAEKMKPLLRFLFPSLPEDHPAGRLMAANMVANLLGLGSAATPAGLKAMESLRGLEDDRRAGRMPGPARKAGTAGNEMCTFLILNISSLQLIPMNMIAYRSQYGSAEPAAIIGAGIAATAVSTGAAVVFCKVMERGWKKE